MSQWTIIITLFSYGSMLQQVQLVYIKNMSRLTKIICSRKIISKNYFSLVSTDYFTEIKIRYSKIITENKIPN